MTYEKFNEKFIEILCSEFQSIWFINLDTFIMSEYWSDKNTVIPGSIDSALEMGNYDTVRKWYVENHVAVQNRERVLQQSTVENVLKMTEDGKPFFIGYGRIYDGNINYNQFCFNRIENEDGEVRYIILGLRDIDERKHADIDDITGLLTRHAFFERAEEMLQHNADDVFDVVISDIIDFKNINETYGIKIADKILHWIGNYLAPLSGSRLLIGRYGSDQMVLLGHHDEIMSALSDISGQKYMDALKVSGLPLFLTKFGVYQNIRHDTPVIASCDKAHIALNGIKSKYDQLIAFYDDKLESRLETQRKIEESMHDSLKNNHFKVYYQPKHDTVTGKINGAEALIRWEHPEYGFMSPSDFISQFEMNGFVKEIDYFVWKRTCENLRRWMDKGIEVVPVSVNASKLSFSQHDLIKRIQKPVSENRIPSKYLHIEITETLMSDDVDDLIMKLTALRALGYEIELDDFGAGYSSINLLSTLPIDVIKLDMSFVQHFENEKRTKVLAACINLAKELGYKTVSEGVELREQHEILGILGVDIIQGYLYSKPLSEEEFEQYLISQSEL